MEKISKKKNIMCMSNLFCVPHKQQQLSLMAQKIEALLITQIEETDDDLKIYGIESKDFENIFEVSKQHLHKDLNKALEELKSHNIYLYSHKEKARLEFKLISVVARYEDKNTIGLGIDPRMKPFFIDLKKGGNFTIMELQTVLSFSRSSYSYDMYKFLKSRLFKEQKSHKFKMPISELRLILGVNGKYAEFRKFSEKVLTPVQKEISEKSDIKFEFSVIRLHRKPAVEIEIKITRKRIQTQNKITTTDKIDEDFERVQKQRKENDFEISDLVQETTNILETV